eukprot:SAG11_NODE_1256_length_5374_cov_5.627627_1_plen_63_part_00
MVQVKHAISSNISNGRILLQAYQGKNGFFQTKKKRVPGTVPVPTLYYISVYIFPQYVLKTGI